MTKPIILVLEDMFERIDWLKVEFESSAKIIWAKSVDQFFDKLQLIDKSMLKVILLDHDLSGINDGSSQTSLKGPGCSWPLDPDGKNGRDAVAGLDGWADIPTIVWSINNVSAPRMVKDLKDKGFSAGWIPFISTHRNMLRQAIAALIAL